MTASSPPTASSADGGPEKTTTPRRRLKDLLTSDVGAPGLALKDWFDILKKGVEIVAIICAGWWAYTRYFSGEAPSLEERAHVQLSVRWLPVDSTKCTAFFHASVKNIGKRSFDLSGINLKVWLPSNLGPEEADGGAGKIVRVDIDRLMRDQEPLYREKISQGSIIAHYSPDTTYFEDYIFSIPQLPGRDLAIFEFDADATASLDQTKSIDATEWMWSPVCPSSTQPQIEQSAD